MKRLNKDNTLMLLIDHQVGTLTMCHNRPKEMIVSRTRALAKIGKALGMPIVLTSSMEEKFTGLLLPDLQEILPEQYAKRVKRSGIANAWFDENYKKPCSTPLADAPTSSWLT